MKAISALKTYFDEKGMGRALRHRDFVIYATTHMVASVGFWVQRLGISWLTWELTHSAKWLGIIAAVEALPNVVLLPIAGAVADRVDRLRLYRHMQIIVTLLAFLVAVLTIGEWIDEYLILGIMFLSGIAHAMSMPARMTIVPGVVPREDVTPAIALDAVLFQCTAFIGPMMAGVVITMLGVGYTFAFSGATFAVFIAGLYMIRFVYHEHSADPSSGVITDMWDGLRYVAKHRSLGPMLFLAVAASVLTKPYMDLLPGFADAVFERGAEGLAILATASGIGGILSNLLIAVYGRTEGLTAMVLASAVATSVVLFVFAIIPWFWLGTGLIAIVAFSAGITATGSQILMQTGVDGHMRGRVMSLYAMTWRGAPALGALILGWTASYFGLQTPVAAAAIVYVVAWVWVYRRRQVVALGLETPAGDESVRGQAEFGVKTCIGE